MRQAVNKLDYTTRDYEGFRSLMISKLRELMPEYTDIRQSDAGIVILELNAMCLDILSYYLDSIANECFLVTAEQRSNVIKFCKMLGYTPRSATSAHYNQVFVKTNKDVEIVIPKGTKVKTYSSNQDKVIYFTTTNDLVIPKGAFGDEKDQNDNYIYSVDVIHGLYVNNEELIRLSGKGKNQIYSLNYYPALVDNTFNVYVNDAVSGSEMWSRVTTFAGSNSTSKVYMTQENDFGETSIIFGDGSFGKIPAESQITCSYFIGGGKSGNVGIGSINVMEDIIAGVQKTFNCIQTETGYDRETLDEIKINAPIAHRNIWGALTVDDYAGVVKTYFPDIKYSQAKKASTDWSTPKVDDIEIYILTNGEIETQNEGDFFQPIPESYYSGSLYTGLITRINGFFNSDVDYIDVQEGKLDTGRKLVGSRDINIKCPNYAEISLTGNLMARSYYNATEISNKISDYLKDKFKLGNVNFGDFISLQELTYDILDNSGIDGIRYLSFDIEGEKDDKGEIHNNLIDYTNKDLIIPKISVIIVLKDLKLNLLTEPNGNNGGVTVE